MRDNPFLSQPIETQRDSEGMTSRMRVLSIRESVWLNCRPDEVWRCLIGLEDWARWGAGVTRSRWCGAPGWRVGSRFEITTPWHRLPMRSKGRVLAVSPGESLGWEGRLWGLPGQFQLQVETVGLGSRVTFHAHFRSWAARVAMRPRLAGRIAGFQRKFLGALRKRGEQVRGVRT